MRIDSHDRFENVSDFDPPTGSLQERNRALEGGSSPALVEGHYARLSGVLAVLYRLDACLWLRIGEVARNLDEVGVVVGWWHVQGDSTLELMERGAVVAEVHYRPCPGGGSEDPTPFAESEDWDFGLFVKNVLGNEGRRSRIYGGAPSR